MAEQGVATNRLPAARRKRHDNLRINPEIEVRPQAACGSTWTLAKKIMSQKPPYMMTYGRISHIIQKIKEAKTPDRFTNDFLKEVIGAKGTNDRAFISLAKRCKILNQDGSPTELYKKIRSTSNTTSKGAMAEAIQSGYSDLYSMNEYAHKLDDSGLEGLLLQITGAEKGDKMVTAIIKTFNALKEFADFDLELEANDTPAEEERTEETPSTSQPSISTPVPQQGSIPLGLSYQINLVLPKTDDISVFNAIFKSLKDNLLDK